jgi:hypothetical protein
MRIILLRLCFAFVLFFVIYSCSKSSNSSQQCNISTVPDTTPAAGTVTYTASFITGTGSVTSISYQGANGMVNVMNPTLPWSSGPLNVQSGASISITLVGSTNGTLAAGYQFTNGGIDDFVDQVQCSNS